MAEAVRESQRKSKKKKKEKDKHLPPPTLVEENNDEGTFLKADDIPKVDADNDSQEGTSQLPIDGQEGAMGIHYSNTERTHEPNQEKDVDEKIVRDENIIVDNATENNEPNTVEHSNEIPSTDTSADVEKDSQGNVTENIASAPPVSIESAVVSDNLTPSAPPVSVESEIASEQSQVGLENCTSNQIELDTTHECVEDVTYSVADIRVPLADVSDPIADVRDPVADVRDPVADVRDPVADMRDPLADVGNPLDIRTNEATASEVVSTNSERTVNGVITTLKDEGIRTHQRLHPNLMRQQSQAMLPFTDDELTNYYFNPMLQHHELYVESFVKQTNVTNHELYELLLNFFKSRSNLLAVIADISSVRKDYKNYTSELWISQENHITANGRCADGFKVSQTVTYSTVEFNYMKLHEVERTLKLIRSFAHDTLSLCLYTAQLSRLQIESYLYFLITKNPTLESINKYSPITAHLVGESSREDQQQIERLRQCISVLFAFQRRPTQDQVFIDVTREWLKRLIAILLRLASIPDHLFILNHLLRCPAGLDQWATSFLQVYPPPQGYISGPLGSTWGSPLLDHFVDMLDYLMSPVRYREEYLSRLRVAMTPDTSKASDTNPFAWTIVDEDGEEDEDADNQWLMLHENDLVGLLAQFPFDKCFRHVLAMDSTDEDEYAIERVGSHHVVKLIAFATCVINILKKGLTTFNKARYRQFVKRIGRMIRHTVQYVSDHWLNYRDWRISCGDDEDAIPSLVPYDAQFSLKRLQLEIDQFYFRATSCILSAKRLGTWQFMSEMPHNSISLLMMWKLLWLLHSDGSGLEQEVPQGAGIDAYKWRLSDPANRGAFDDKLGNMSMQELIYLLTAFTSMARSRPASDVTFINFIAVEIFELSYARDHTKNFCCKIGRELLSGLASTHPFIMSTLLCQVKDVFLAIGTSSSEGHFKKQGIFFFYKMSMYLFRELPLHLWQPSSDDMELIRHWLVDFVPSSVENQLARLILNRLNWGFNDQRNALVLDIKLHRYVAILIVDAHCKHIGSKAMEAGLISGGILKVSQIATNIRSMLTTEQSFDVWAWEVLMKLHLHINDQPCQALLPSGSRSGPEGFEEHLDIHLDPVLYLVQKGVKNNTPVACYVAVSMTKIGHVVEDFITHGLKYLQVLIDANNQKMCIPLLGMVVKTFLKENKQKYLVTNEKFLNIIWCILQADTNNSRITQRFFQTSFPGETTKCFTSMIVKLLQDFNTSDQQPDVIVAFWLNVLTFNSNWYQDLDTQYVLNALLQVAFRVKDGIKVATDFLFALYKTSAGNSKSQGLLSSVLSYVTTSVPQPSFLEAQSSQYVWLAYTILLAEQKFLADIQLHKFVYQELYKDQKVTPEVALKKGANKLKLGFTPMIQRLPIYRWASQVLETDTNHPLLPIMWQRFFGLYLLRLAPEPGLPSRGSVGEKFFASLMNVSLLKRLKKQLTATADYHHFLSKRRSTSNQNGNDEDEDSTSPELSDEYKSEAQFHQKLVTLYQTFALWIEEPLLHDPQLYLPSLPQQYDAEKLRLAFNDDEQPWLEFVDSSRVDFEILQHVKFWMKLSSSDVPDIGSGSINGQIETATSRILSHLESYDKSQGPPEVTATTAPVPEVQRAMLLSENELIANLHPHFVLLVDYASCFTRRETLHVSLDCTYLELSPELQFNQTIERRLRIPCSSTFNPTHRCDGPAVVTLTFKEKKVNTSIFRKLEENRNEFMSLLEESQTPPADDIVTAAVYIENTITDLINFNRASQGEEYEKSKKTGIDLFYYFANRTTEDVRHYPPTRQFFSSCIEILGQEFIRNNPDQAKPLLQLIISNLVLANLLSPNFRPSACAEDFVGMYGEVVSVTMNASQDLAVMLLTKFDVKFWLNGCAPDRDKCYQMVDIVGEALCLCKQKPETQLLTQFEMYRTHLQILLSHHFPDNFNSVLQLLLKGSAGGCLSPDIWFDFLHIIGCPVSHLDESLSNIDFTQVVGQTASSLTLAQVHETIQWLTTYFSKMRNTTPDLAKFGLYSKWKPYIQPIANLFRFLITTYIVHESTKLLETQQNPEQGIQQQWLVICGLFAPWIDTVQVPSPSDATKTIFLPAWVEVDWPSGVILVAIFAEAVRSLTIQFQGYLPPSGKDAMSLLLFYYANSLARKEVTVDALQIYNRRFEKLPWQQYHPDIHCMDLMLNMYESNPPESFVFLSNILPMMDWEKILQHYIQTEHPSTVTRFCSNFLSILIMLASNVEIMTKPLSKIPAFIVKCQSLDWRWLDAQSYEAATQWQIENSDPRDVLCARGSIKNNITDLLRAIAGFNSESADWPEGPLKRHSYVNLLISLLCKVSHMNGVNQDMFETIIHNLLNDIEIVGTAGGLTMDQNQELISLVTTVLSLLNNCNPIGGLLTVAQESILKWVEVTSSSVVLPFITATCRTLASIGGMSILVEVCVRTHFKAADLSEGNKYGWAPVLGVLEVPELAPHEFLVECLKHSSYLTLYAYILQSLSKCQSLEEETALLTLLIKWNMDCRPRQDNETKLLLWWGKIVDLCLRQVEFGAKHDIIVRTLNNFIPAIAVLGENKKSGGILGAIGLGKRSELTIKFRLIARALAAYLAAQIPGDTGLRLEPNAPGAILPGMKLSSPTSPKGARPSALALQTFKTLDTTVDSKAYASIRDTAVFARKFLQDPSHTLRDTKVLLGHLAAALYPKEQYLAVVRTT
ncbi:ectopic P granules protein 5 homolog isoform X3 [Anneissia japonica]|uniref:ectopic P granules protein 5 homolog isoform X3 n=1 Tax=Anneissia japonica TaxID=1529436 RepID=UPI001425A78D|nr:ectopic P granules protein 5 homolog isoform X3 [Anneissia japonica]